ncbi:hypothetical protein HY449_02110 [Candidatus Pacearchaeota archaeon]|nr:hypothetical protein [Candidatus Pacearchaeota archaeon]
MNKTFLSRINSVLVFACSIILMAYGFYFLSTAGFFLDSAADYGVNWSSIVAALMGIAGIFLSFFVWKERRRSFILSAIFAFPILIYAGFIGFFMILFAGFSPGPLLLFPFVSVALAILVAAYVFITSIILFFKKEDKKI